MSRTTTSKRSLHRPMILFLVLVIVGVLAWLIHEYVSLEALIEREQAVREAIAARPVLSFIIGFGIYFLLSLVPGTGGKGVVYGWLFGFWQAVTIMTVGLAGAGMIIFYISRYLFQTAIERRYPRFLARMNRHILKEGAFYLLTLRMAHAPFSIVNPVSGASRVSAWVFLWTLVVGLLPANIIWAYVGYRLPSLDELAVQGAAAFLDTLLIAGLVGSALLPWLVRLLVRRFGLPGDEVFVQEGTDRGPDHVDGGTTE